MSAEEIFEILNHDCSYYLNELRNCGKGKYLLRGYNYDILDIKLFEHDLEGRKPRNMPQHIHDMINNIFLEKVGWKIRNGIFTYGFDMLNYKPKDLGYGPFALFFPIGDFEFAYSPHYFDLFGEVNQLKTDLDTFINNLEFEYKTFCNVMYTNGDYDNFGNEVSIRATTYYLVNPEFAKELALKIWN